MEQLEPLEEALMQSAEQLEPPAMEPPEQLDYQAAEPQVPMVPPAPMELLLEVPAEAEVTPSRND